LILDGAGTLASADFHRLSQAAKLCGNDLLSITAQRFAENISASLSIPELTRLLSFGLVELRDLLDAPSPLAQSQPSHLPPNQPDTREKIAPPTPENNCLAADKDLILEFIVESTEHLANIERQMLVLEKDNAATETLNAVFRGFHTIKGLAGFLELAEIQAFAHEVETLLDVARTTQLAVTSSFVDVVLESTDAVRLELAAIAQNLDGKIPPLPSGIDAALLQKVRDLTRAGSEPAGFANSPEASAKPVPAPEQTTQVPKTLEPREVIPDSPPTPAGSVNRGAPLTDASSVRIATSKLDQLMDMVGEMVIAQTLIGHSPALAALKDAPFLRDLMQLARITADVQKITTGMRMVPIGLQFQKTARMIRDLSRRAGKSIAFETTGEDTELDKTIAEELSDPLLHMVRNSIDHGIESPEERTALGKDPTARIRLAAYHQGGQIVVSISDDGRGLNRERILAKAIQNGLIQAGAQLSDNEIFLLIFEAGFSTAERVSDISGRGVGMDVVRRHVQKLRGRIDIQSNSGEGTTFSIKLPLTLAIIEGLVVVVGQQRYIVPIFSVSEMFRPTRDMLSTVQGKGEMVMVRGRLLPIVRLHQHFQALPRTFNFTEGTLIVTESEGRQFCLFVDDLIAKQEVVIKSLGQSFKNIVGIAGCAILGDGRVGLILDVDGIYKGRF
jgi:two-component system, chemotaxis family, sensor kinase CheA